MSRDDYGSVRSRLDTEQHARYWKKVDDDRYIRSFGRNSSGDGNGCGCPIGPLAGMGTVVYIIACAFHWVPPTFNMFYYLHGG
jgi:hypothetical protein